MDEVKICLKCKEIITFCECDKPIIDKDEYIKHLEKQLNKPNNRKKDLKICWDMARLRRFDTGWNVYTNFNDWYKKYNNLKK